ncbi:MAG: carbohydrate ABC transporter substrate-binding protein [Alphaproteobacteria bacterium]|nr:MAG: carbohydrate ABC transporter substrate-binding protein [Alphaproteobacteria bacterium]
MKRISRRQALVGGGAAVAAGTVVMPRGAKAAGELTVWWTQGFYKAENDAVVAWMADWDKRNNTKVNLTIMNGPDLITKLIAGMQVGDVPDVVHTVTGDRFLVPRAAWNDQLEDVSEVVDSQKAEFTETALLTARLYNAKQKKYSYYGVPTKASSLMNSVWLPLLQDAGFAETDMPGTQDKFYDFFQTVQDKLRSKGKRIFGLGYSMAAKEADAGNLFHQFLVSYGGVGIVLPDGKLNIDDPAVRKAATTSLERLTTPFKKGYVPPGAINWGDVDNNNAFFARQIVMTPNATISIAAAQMDKPDLYYKEILTRGVPLGNDGKPVASVLAIAPTIIPKGSKNVDAAKALLRDFIQPANHGLHREERSVLDRPERPAPHGCGGYGADQADGAVVDVLQPRLFGRAVRADLAAGGSQYHAAQHDPGTGHRGSGQTAQAAVRAVSEMTTRPRGQPCPRAARLRHGTGRG